MRVFTTAIALSILGITASQPSFAQSPLPSPGTAECAIQITSVTIDPREAHASKESALTTVTVQVSVLGNVPPGAVATVGVLTYSSEPVGNNVRYEDQQTQPLKGSPTLFRFRVYGNRTTVKGHLIILADIRAATAGITVKDAVEPSSDRTRLEITAP